MMFGGWDNQSETLSKDLLALQREAQNLLSDSHYCKFIYNHQRDLFYDLTSVAGVSTLTNATILMDTIEKVCAKNAKGKYIPSKIDDLHCFIDFIRGQVPWA